MELLNSKWENYQNRYGEGASNIDFVIGGTTVKDIIYSKGSISGLTLKNRMIMPSIHLGYAEEGKVNQQILDFYEQRARGGIAAIIIGGVSVEKGGSLAGMLSLETDSFIEGFQTLTDVVHKHDCKIFVQLFHAGRNVKSATVGQLPIAPSAVPSPITKENPREMNEEDIRRIIKAFGSAADRAKKAGVDGVEISCSAGYLLAQFLSTLTNHRKDIYGGSEDNRMRFPREVVKEVRGVVGAGFPIILRISGSSMIKDSYDIDYMKKFCSSFDDGELDAIHVTGGWHEAPVPQISAHVPPGAYAFLASAVRKVVKVPVIASNRINDGIVARTVLSNGLSDFVAIGRGLVAEPELPNKIKKNMAIRKCQACNQGCIDNVFKELPVYCMVNGSVGREKLKIIPASKPKKILVVGGGVAGMEAARIAALANHHVILCTKEAKLGGQIHLASVPPNKKELLSLSGYLISELRRLNVIVENETEVDADFIQAVGPGHVILATGSRPIVPNIPGVKGKHVHTAVEVLAAQADRLREICNGKILIAGGGAVGLETAVYLGNRPVLPKEVSEFLKHYLPQNKDAIREFEHIGIVEIQENLGKDMGKSIRWVLMKELAELGIKTFKNTRITSIEPDKVIVERNGMIEEIPADTVILAIGSRAYDANLRNFLDQEKIPYSIIGDAHKPGSIMDAMSGALQAVVQI
ncbi:NAD(P)/FAD-dependent oxidoreductase [Sporomusa sp.]|uniref:NAD(P)/FAD-dependent oxidoreductase n=1 Tax=Sporomusa sp. TaxID=2078658 RepID=UPI002C81ACF2|nr:NAD(P)/FAD-dependent oxidoreductase [Sporomusa sp.]HWR42951.1 NAD(P)/FAD-dependent oxidoreductase [Sporomusa sp.]